MCWRWSNETFTFLSYFPHFFRFGFPLITTVNREWSLMTLVFFWFPWSTTMSLTILMKCLNSYWNFYELYIPISWWILNTWGITWLFITQHHQVRVYFSQKKQQPAKLMTFPSAVLTCSPWLYYSSFSWFSLREAHFHVMIAPKDWIGNYFL